MTIVMVLSSVLHIYYLGKLLERHKERAGLMAVNVLLQILCPLTFLDHPKKLPEIPHAIVYMLGASGLSIVNSITLLTELISKAETGERNVADLRVIVLLAESVYICCWMPLQLYSACKYSF
ncbi:hypothetical protein AALO_G00187760 [Alosa alosa]|uniref:Uncharacterized protein n=1 Tax=Alosa alosa TaxID=278164 RepID=A0AAV6G9D6_9TELE|nr:hypothetical protein AALO_G00187760 [Alosa alosa]